MTIALTRVADRLGRRRVLVAGALLMALAGAVFALTDNPLLLGVAAVVGTINPSGKEVGPFLSVEQAVLPQTTADEQRTSVFAAYNLVSALAGALGALAAGLPDVLGLPPVDGYRALVWGYAAAALALAALFARLSPGVEPAPPPRLAQGDAASLTKATPTGTASTAAPAAPRPAATGAPAPPSPAAMSPPPPSSSAGTGAPPPPSPANPPLADPDAPAVRGTVARLAALFALDAFAGGFIVQGLLAYWFFLRFGVEPATLGAIFFGTNLLAAVSFLAAPALARRIGLLNTMVATHLPSNVLLLLIPLMPTLELAAGTLMARNLISQMDVPTRQSYTMAIIPPAERAAAAGVMSVARNAAAAAAPAFAGVLLAVPTLGLPFLAAGSLKIVYDLAIWSVFRHVHPPEEAARHAPRAASTA
jgi:MFS family permease